MRILAVVATLLFVTPAAATIGADEAPKAAKPAKEKKICRATQTSASRLGGRPVCKTKAEWDADREAQQRDLETMSRAN